MTEAQIVAERREREAQANQRWKPLMIAWRGWLGQASQRDEAERAIAAVTDPHAVPSIWAVFVEAGGGERG